MDIFNWIIWLIVGAVTGWLASIVVSVKIQHRSLLDVLSGIVGAMIGGGLFYGFGTPGITEFNIWSLLAAFTGAVILLAALRLYIRMMGLSTVTRESER